MHTAHVHNAQSAPEPTGIVSVNSRGAASQAMTGKLAFVALVVCLLLGGAVMAINKYRTAKHAQEVASKAAASEQATPAETGKRRTFDTDPPPIPGTTMAKRAPSGDAGRCADHTSGQPLLGPDGTQLMAPSGQPIRVCSGGQVIVPAIVPLPGDAHPIPVVPNRPKTAPSGPAAAPKSRYGGDVLLPASASAGITPALDPHNPYIQALLRTSQSAAQGGASQPSGAPAASSVPTDSAPPSGALPALLRGSEPRPVAATMIGNRDMILPEGRSIDCNLSVRLINDVSGKATCVLSSNVYSDNGKVVLAERGSIAVGEYVAIAAQGQRRLFVLWTRLQTPNGVVINVNSPAADALGTSGLPGYVDNRWADRIGAAVLLSLVEDAIAYETAKASSENGGGGAQGVAVFQSTTQTGRSLAERILESTINIKPTIYKNQGDRTTIFVSRDLDFGSVYALRAK